MARAKYAIAVMSADRVGIINNVTDSILQIGGNIDKLSQTVMDGFFTILITAVFPAGPDAESIGEAITEGGRHLGLEVAVRPYVKARHRESAETPNVYVLTVIGADRKGIIHEISGCLAGHDINIVDLYCFLRRPGEFVLIGEIDVPSDQDLAQIQIDLEAIGEEGGPSHGLSVRIQHENLFLATSNLYLSRQQQGTQR